MKKIILLAFATLMIVGCNWWNTTYEVDTKRDGILYGTIMIDSCEYIRGNNRLAHKGNCRFCKERRQQEMKELVEQLKEE